MGRAQQDQGLRHQRQWHCGLWVGLAGLLSLSMALPRVSWAQVPVEPEAIGPLTSVNQLRDVQPTDWAFEALRSLIEKHDCGIGYPDQTFRGDRALTRAEFAAGLDACLNRIVPQLMMMPPDGTWGLDRQALQQLQTEFATELATLRGTLTDRIEQLEIKAQTLDNQAFAPITKLTGLAIVAVNAGGFSGDRIVAPRGAVISRDQPNATSLYRVSLDLNTSFVGTDLLKMRLLAASPGVTDNAAGLLEPNLASGLDFAIPGTMDLSLARLYYTFKPQRDLSVTVGARMVAADFVDKNRYANVSFRDFSTAALVNNFILLPRPGGAGMAIDWNPNKGPLSLRAIYIASDADASLPDSQQFFGGGGPNDIRLFPVGGGGAKGGFFGDPYTGTLELEYAPQRTLAVRLQYSGGELLGRHFQVFGVNAEWSLTRQVGVFARYGVGSYPDTTVGDLNPHYWSAGVVGQDLFLKNDLAGIGVGQPLMANQVGNATQTNFEVFYNLPLSNRIRLTPLIQVITDPGNQRSNGAIVTGTLRTVFSF